MENKIKEIEEKLLRKEQECEELKAKCSQLEEKIKDWQKEVERIQFIGSYGIMDEVKKNTKLKNCLTEIKQLLEDALDTDKTNAEQSFDNIHKAIKLCEVLKQ